MYVESREMIQMNPIYRAGIKPVVFCPQYFVGHLGQKPFRNGMRVSQSWQKEATGHTGNSRKRHPLFSPSVTFAPSHFSFFPFFSLFSPFLFSPPDLTPVV